jgi:hypothetical protein
MDTITLTYGAESKVYTILGPPRGFQRFAAERYWPPTQDDLPDGSIRQKFSGRARTITIEFGVIDNDTDRNWLMLFFLSNVMQLTYNGETVDVCLPLGLKEFYATRHSDYIYTPQYSVTFLEKSMSASAPASYS